MQSYAVRKFLSEKINFMIILCLRNDIVTCCVQLCGASITILIMLSKLIQAANLNSETSLIFLNFYLAAPRPTGGIMKETGSFT